MNIDTKLKTIEQTTGIKLHAHLEQYDPCFKDLMLEGKKVSTNYNSQKVVAYGKEVQRSIVESQQNLVLGWVIEDFMCKQLGAIFNGCDKDRKFEGDITTEPDLFLADGTKIEVKASFKNEIVEHGRFYIKQHSLRQAQKKGTTLCIVDIVNGSYQLIDPQEVKVVGSAFCHDKVWLHFQVDLSKMQKFRGSSA